MICIGDLIRLSEKYNDKYTIPESAIELVRQKIKDSEVTCPRCGHTHHLFYD